MPRVVTEKPIFNGNQVENYCNKILRKTEQFLDAADAAANQNSAAPLQKFFGASRWEPDQQQTMLVLCTSFRRFAISMPAEARRLAETIRDNCKVKSGDGNYVHW